VLPVVCSYTHHVRTLAFGGLVTHVTFFFSPSTTTFFPFCLKTVSIFVRFLPVGKSAQTKRVTHIKYIHTVYRNIDAMLIRKTADGEKQKLPNIFTHYVRKTTTSFWCVLGQSNSRMVLASSVVDVNAIHQSSSKTTE